MKFGIAIAVLVVMVCDIHAASNKVAGVLLHDNGTYSTLTVNGLTYSNVTFGTVTRFNVTVFHSTGHTQIPLGELPPHLQKRFGFGPHERAAYEANKAQVRQAIAQAMEQQTQIILKESKEQAIQMHDKLKKVPQNLLLTVDGTTYSNVVFDTVQIYAATFFHSTGHKKIPLAKLPPELQQVFGFGPDQKAAWLKVAPNYRDDDMAGKLNTNETNLTFTVDGIIYSNVVFGTATHYGTVTIRHSTGFDEISRAKLPPDLQQRFPRDGGGGAFKLLPAGQP